MSIKERAWEVYTLTDPRTLRARYVGVTFNPKKRFNAHINRADCLRTHCAAWIRSLKTLNLTPIYLMIESGVGSSWNEREQFWIAAHRKFCDLTNHTDGGEGTLGFVPSLELRAKWSRVRKGKKRPKEFGEKISRMFKGRILAPPTAEARANMSAAGRGRKKTPEHRAKIGASQVGKYIPEVTRQKYRDAWKRWRERKQKEKDGLCESLF